MDVLHAIKTRRSIRSYTTELVSEELLEQVLEAGRWAPSAKNRQHWHFIVIRDEKLRAEIGELWGREAQRYFDTKSEKELTKEFGQQVGEYADERWVKDSKSGAAYRDCYGAPVLIVVAISHPEMENNLYSAFLAVENMALAAHASGLGTCITRRVVMDERGRLELQNMLGMPEGVEAVALITLGYPEKIPNTKRKPFQDVVHYERFGNKERRML